MNTADLLVALTVAGMIALAVVILRRNRKHGITSCGCDCPHCGQSCEKK